MADMSDIIQRFGGARRSGGSLIFQRNGRDAGDFAELRQLGEVQVKTNEIVVKLSKAQRDLRTINRRLEGATARAKALVAHGQGFAVPRTKASRKSRKAALRAAGFAVTSESLGLGPVRLGKQGLTANRTLLAGAGGTAMTASLGLHLAAWAGHGALDTKERIDEMRKEGATRMDIAKAAASGTAKTTVTGAADLFGVSSITSLIGRFKGLTKEDSEAWLERHWDTVFDSQQSIQRRRNERQRAINKVAEEANGVIDETWEKIGQFRPQGFRIKGKRDLQAFEADMNKANRKNLAVRRSALREQFAGQADMMLPEVP
jgi:hypothetical protein